MFMNNILTIPSYTLQDTTQKNLFRFVDRDGNWNHYFLKPGNKYIPAMSHVLHTSYNKGQRFNEYLLSVSKEEAKKVLESAGDSGTRVHEAISDLIRGRKVTMETKYLNRSNNRQEVLNKREWTMIEAFIGWVEKYKPQTILNEHSVNNGFKYAGTLDWFGTIEIEEVLGRGKTKVVTKKRIFVLLDWKSSGGIWDEYPMQVSGYREACVYKKIKHAKGCHTGILRLGTRHKSGFEFKLYSPEETDENFEKFSTVLDLYNRTVSTFEPTIRDIPTEFEAIIPKFEELKKKNGKVSPKKVKVQKVRSKNTPAQKVQEVSDTTPPKEQEVRSEQETT